MPATKAFKDTENVTMFKTPNGKNIKVVQINNTALYGAAFHEGGQLPKELSGMWTSVDRVVKEIKKYIEGLEAKATTKGTK